MSEPRRVQSVDRALDLLEVLADLGGAGGLSELAHHCNLPPSTIHRLMRTLMVRGYARQLPSRQYALGPRVVSLGDVGRHQLGNGVGPHLERLARSLGESANLAILDRDKAVYIAQAASNHSMRMFTEVGSRVHCHCTGVGKIMLAQLSKTHVREIAASAGLPAATERSLTDVEELLVELDKINHQGYAIDDGEQEVGVRCFAVAVPGTPAPAALSVSGPDTRVTAEFGYRAVPLLHEVAAAIAQQLVHTT